MPIQYEVRPDVLAVEITGAMLAEDILAFYGALAADRAFPIAWLTELLKKSEQCDGDGVEKRD